MMYGRTKDRSFAWISSTKWKLRWLIYISKIWTAFGKYNLPFSFANIRKWHNPCKLLLYEMLQAIHSVQCWIDWNTMQTIHHFAYQKKCPDKDSVKIRWKTISHFRHCHCYLLLRLFMLNTIIHSNRPVVAIKTNHFNWFLHCSMLIQTKYQWQDTRKNEQSFSLFIITAMAWSNEHVKHFMVQYTHSIQFSHRTRWQFCLILLMIHFYAWAITFDKLSFFSQLFRRWKRNYHFEKQQ